MRMTSAFREVDDVSSTMITVALSYGFESYFTWIVKNLEHRSAEAYPIIGCKPVTFRNLDQNVRAYDRRSR